MFANNKKYRNPDAGIGIISGSVPGLVKKKGRDF